MPDPPAGRAFPPIVFARSIIMRNGIRNPCISVPVPTELYVSMRDLLGNANMECGPALLPQAFLRECLGDASERPPAKKSAGARPSTPKLAHAVS
jgi:hypothetical protein